TSLPPHVCPVFLPNSGPTRSDPPMRRDVLLPSLLLALIVAFVFPRSLRADYPKPSPYPKSWELKFEHGTPKRIVVQAPPSTVPKAYWYMTYTVTNDTDQHQLFLLAFELR